MGSKLVKTGMPLAWLVLFLVALVAVQAAPVRAQEAILSTLNLENPADLGTVVSGGQGEIRISAQGPSTICLGVVEKPGVDDCLLEYRAQLKSRNLQGRAYLEMWCMFPGKGEYFSRGLQNTISGNVGWTEVHTRFTLKPGQKPSRVVLSLVIAGQGEVWIRKPRLLKKSLP